MTPFTSTTDDVARARTGIDVSDDLRLEACERASDDRESHHTPPGASPKAKR
jgi:hypothetical protein